MLVLAEMKVKDLRRQVTHIFMGYCSCKTNLIKDNVSFFFNLNMSKVVFCAFLELPPPFICVSHFKILCNIIGYSLISLNCGRLSNRLEVTSSHGVFFWAHSFTWSTSYACSPQENKKPTKTNGHHFLRII